MRRTRIVGLGGVVTRAIGIAAAVLVVSACGDDETTGAGGAGTTTATGGTSTATGQGTGTDATGSTTTTTSTGSGDGGASQGGSGPGGAGGAGQGGDAQGGGGGEGGAGSEFLDVPLPDGCVSLDLQADCGAAGDGVTNDSQALRDCADDIEAAGCGELIIPPATYVVGEQIEKQDPDDPGPWYAAQAMFQVADLTFLRVIAYGATLRIADGLHYGAFDPDSGDPIDVTGGVDNKGDVGRIIEISDSRNVYILGGEYDGNNTKLVLGGQWGDKDRQTSAAGIWTNHCADVVIADVHTHHHGLDGITVVHRNEAPTEPTLHRLFNVVSEYNGRQGLSWIGGWGLEVYDSAFNHTGRAINEGGGEDDGQPLRSAPAAGVDIEPNAGTEEESRDGYFLRSEFVDNAGAGMLADVGDGGYSTFEDCTFWATTHYSIWARRPGLRFIDSRIHGTAVHPHDGRTEDDPDPNPVLATYFENCTFEDLEYDGVVRREGSLFNIGGGEGEGVTFKDCTFRNHETRAISAGDASTREIFEGCTFSFENPDLPSLSQQATFSGSEMRGVHFVESDTIADGARDYFIQTTEVTVAEGDPTVVDGPNVHWDSASGDTGEIAPGVY